MYSAHSLVAYRKALESGYTGRCNIYHTEEFEQDDGGTGFDWVCTSTNVPCFLSHGGASPSASRGEAVDTVNKSITLYCAPEIVVRAGSRIEVTQSGDTHMYECASIPTKRDTHQVLSLEVMDHEC